METMPKIKQNNSLNKIEKMVLKCLIIKELKNETARDKRELENILKKL